MSGNCTCSRNAVMFSVFRGQSESKLNLAFPWHPTPFWGLWLKTAGSLPVRMTTSHSFFFLTMNLSGRLEFSKMAATVALVPQTLVEAWRSPSKRWYCSLSLDCDRLLWLFGLMKYSGSDTIYIRSLKMIQLPPCELKCLGLESWATMEAVSLLWSHHALRKPK